MKTNESNKWKLTLQIDEETSTIIKNLREKHHVNISAVCREALSEWNKKLETR